MSAPVDVWRIVSNARKNPDLVAEAALILERDVPRWFAPREREGIRASDAGRCLRELWADVHDMLDLPQEIEGQLNRLDIGTIMGAWYGALFAAALPAITDFHCTLEETITHEDIPGHADVVVYLGDTALQVIDFKSNYAARSAGPAKSHQCLQVARYALGKGAQLFSIFTITPATSSPMHRQDNFNTADWAQAVEIESARLKAALGEDMPAAVPPDGWRCKYCRFSLCEKNPAYQSWGVA